VGGLRSSAGPQSDPLEVARVIFVVCTPLVAGAAACASHLLHTPQVIAACRGVRGRDSGLGIRAAGTVLQAGAGDGGGGAHCRCRDRIIAGSFDLGRTARGKCFVVATALVLWDSRVGGQRRSAPTGRK